MIRHRGTTRGRGRRLGAALIVSCVPARSSSAQASSASRRHLRPYSPCFCSPAHSLSSLATARLAHPLHRLWLIGCCQPQPQPPPGLTRRVQPAAERLAAIDKREQQQGQGAKHRALHTPTGCSFSLSSLRQLPLESTLSSSSTDSASRCSHVGSPFGRQRAKLPLPALALRSAE